LTVIPAILPDGGLLGNGIVDSDVDPDVRKAGIVAQGGDSAFLGSAVDRVKFLPNWVADGEIDHGRASHEADSFVRVAVPEGRGLGPPGDPDTGATAKGH
jgi:hypothetical protein